MTPQDLLDPKTGEPLVVPRGIFTEGLRESVELAVKTQIPEGKRGTILAVIDDVGIRGGAIVKLDKRGDWKFSADASRQWSGPMAGKIVIVGSF